MNGTPLLTGGITEWDGFEVAEAEGGVPTSLVIGLPLETDAAQTIAATSGDDADVQAYIKAYRSPTGGDADRVLRVYAPVIVDQVQGAAGLLLATAIEPMEILAQRFTLGQFAPTDLGELIFDMIDETNLTDGETGIRVDHANITATSSIDLDARTNIPSIASIISQFFGMLDGVETWSRPIELAAGKIAELYASPTRGVVTDALFAYGPGTEANCTDMGRTRNTASVGNDQRGYAELLTQESRTNAASIAAVRRRIAYTSFTGETSQTVLGLRTQGLVDRFGSRRAVAEYTIAPDENAPRLYDDYDIGDTITAHFSDGVEWEVQQAVSSAKVIVDESGIESPGAVTVRKPR